jgi:hypothetical protein
MLSFRRTIRLAALVLLAGLLTACITPPVAGPTSAPPAASPTPPPIPTALSTSAPTDEPVVEPTACQNDAEFLADLTIPDGTVVAPGDTVVKTWQVRNTGSCGWHSGYRLDQIAGDLLLADEPVELPVVAPGDEVELTISVSLAVDALPDSEQRAEFQLSDPDGNPFGASLSAVVVTGTPGDDGGGIPTPTPISGG